MRAVADRKVVIAVVHDISLRVFGVVALEFFFGHADRDSLALSGLQHVGLCIADQFDSRFFNAVRDIVFSIRLLEIDLHDLLALIGIARVFHGHGNIVTGFVGILRDGEIRVSKLRVRLTVAECERHVCQIVVIAGVLSAGNKVVVTGLIVTVPDVDAFGIDAVIHIGFFQSRFGIALVGLCESFRRLFTDVVVKKLHGGGRREVVLHIGVGQLSGRNVFAGQSFRDGVNAGRADVSDPKAGVDVDVVGLAVGGRQTVKEVKLYRRRGVEQNDDLLDLVLLFQIGQSPEDRQLVFA